MKKYIISRTGIQVSSYCLGTMYFGSKIVSEQAFRLMDIYAGMGGNFLDTANKYASWIPGFRGGESETVVGRWLGSRRRTDFVIASKMGFAYGDIPRSLKPELIISECEKSLRRLRTDYIDIYFAHAQDISVPEEETLEAFSRLIRQGKVRSIGASNYEAWRLAESGFRGAESGLESYSVLQQRYTVIEPYVGADLGTQMTLTPEHIGYCTANGMAMMAYSPLMAGLYEREDVQLPLAYDSVRNRLVVAKIREYAEKYAYTPSQLVLGCIESVHGIIPIVAASREEHLEQNLTAPDERIVAGLHEEISSIDQFTIKY